MCKRSTKKFLSVKFNLELKKSWVGVITVVTYPFVCEIFNTSTHTILIFGRGHSCNTLISDRSANQYVNNPISFDWHYSCNHTDKNMIPEADYCSELYLHWVPVNLWPCAKLS